MRFEPTEENHFSEEVFGGAVPKNYFPAVEKGFFEACEKGLLAGYPVIGVHAILVDGKYHPVDSNELAFKMAAILAFKDAYLKCKPVILEPIYMIVVTVPQDFTGNILSDLNQRRAKIVGMDVSANGNQKISALVPENEIMEYVNVVLDNHQLALAVTNRMIDDLAIEFLHQAVHLRGFLYAGCHLLFEYQFVGRQMGFAKRDGDHELATLLQVVSLDGTMMELYERACQVESDASAHIAVVDRG